MASRKPARMYRQIRGQAYTRREYMGGVPAMRVAQFDMGNQKGKFGVKLNLVADERCQIRDTSLEAARIAANRYLQKRLGTMNYHVKILVYPHNILRENKQATGAGADRVSDGMRHSFGKAIGQAARVQSDQNLIAVWVNKTNLVTAKMGLRKAAQKLPTPCRVEIHEEQMQ